MIDKTKYLNALDVMYLSAFISNEQYVEQKIEAIKWGEVLMSQTAVTTKVGKDKQKTQGTPGQSGA